MFPPASQYAQWEMAEGQRAWKRDQTGEGDGLMAMSLVFAGDAPLTSLTQRRAGTSSVCPDFSGVFLGFRVDLGHNKFIFQLYLHHRA